MSQTTKDVTKEVNKIRRTRYIRIVIEIFVVSFIIGEIIYMISHLP